MKFTAVRLGYALTFWVIVHRYLCITEWNLHFWLCL